jgi:hypothetical protein
MSESTAMPASSMAATLEHVVKGHYVSTSLIVAGPLFIALGVAIAVKPEILVWVMALAFIGPGSILLVAAVFLRRLASRMPNFTAQFRRMRQDSPSS